jgi:hypothetical protein
MNRIGLIAILLVLSVSPMFAAPPGEQERMTFEGFHLKSVFDANERKYDSAQNFCGLARSYAARFDQDDYMAGKIETCVAFVAKSRGDKVAACASFAKALTLLTKAQLRTAFSKKAVDGEIEFARDARNKLGC